MLTMHEEVKIKKYRLQCECACVRFVPMLMDNSGGYGAGTQRFYNCLANDMAQHCWHGVQGGLSCK
jgi:hypothetical protein